MSVKDPHVKITGSWRCCQYLHWEKLAKNSPDSDKETKSKSNEEKLSVNASRYKALED